jgi:ribosome-associated heat shock protein Hsp15
LSQRLDKWLVYARFVKHRSLATGLIEGGHIRVNKERVAKPGQTVKPNDVLTLAIAGRVKVVRVLGEAERRGPASIASQLYEELVAAEL